MEKINSLINKNKQQYFDFKSLNFEEIIINHDVKEIKMEQAKIKKHVPKELGMYIITSNFDGKVLYVGEGILQERLIKHLNKTRANYSQKSTRLYFFFALPMKMRVFYIEASKIGLTKQEIRKMEVAYKLLLNPIYDQLNNYKKLYKGCKINLDEWDN